MKQSSVGVLANSLGALLVQMGHITGEQLSDIVTKQKKMNEDELLGHIMVSESMLTRDQLDAVLSIQKGLRSKKRYDQAMAQARIAEYCNNEVSATAIRIRQKLAPTDTRSFVPIPLSG